MIPPKLTTYVYNEELLRLVVELGYKKILIEEPHFSLLYPIPFTQNINYNNIQSMFLLGKELNPDVEIIFNLDIIPHESDLEKIDNLLDQLSQYGYDGVRVQDLGLANKIMENYPNFKLELNTITGNHNAKSIHLLETQFSNILKTFVLSKELTYKEIDQIKNKSEIQFELLVHGTLQLLYTKRRLFKESPFNELDRNNNSIYTLYLKERKRPKQWFYFMDNHHGSFMFYCHVLSLINQLDKILSLNISYLLLEFRNKSFEVIKIITKKFQKVLDYYQNNDTLLEENFQISFNDYYPEGLTTGFFLENPTDSNAKKRVEEKLTYAGKAIGIVREKLIALELSHSVSVNDVFTIKTPEGKTFSFVLNLIEDLQGKSLLKADNNQVVLVNWRKGLTPESQFYLMDE